jgi:hypothetical protein
VSQGESIPKPTGKPTMMPVYVVKPEMERRGTMDQLKTWIAMPNKVNEGPAVALLKRCGPLAVNGVQYRLEGDKIVTVSGPALGQLRINEAKGIDPMKLPAGDAS